MTQLKDHNLFLRRTDREAPGKHMRPLLLLLVFVASGLLLLSRLDHSMVSDVRWRASTWLSPVLRGALIPAEPVREIGRSISAQVDLSHELERLRQENQKLESWKWRAQQLESKVADLEALAKTVPEQKIDFLTSRVIADSSGVFVRSVTIDAGRKRNVKEGYPVINGDGLVGRIVDVAPAVSRVLLATDLNSRIPVRIGPNAVRGILAGDNSARPRLIYIPEGANIANGDDVATSGVGGVFPEGLRLGTVVGGLSDPRVALRADLDRLSYVSVLFFADPFRGVTGDLSQRKVSGEAHNAIPPVYPRLRAAP
ncbi:rod shape-determining protein MreC [Hyphomicrobium sp.]|uniref:rod shape-determining protein MreC n=1 Tax=Hyphomicrobium sp. TaxID=82 RepID=UPI002D7A018B|nr:rod shape-determining protein MreC [Hyphomicrobium sp.]HET6390988.1 rod shape-determining protein MreC [Hyphomicrobium sp.]